MNAPQAEQSRPVIATILAGVGTVGVILSLICLAGSFTGVEHGGGLGLAEAAVSGLIGSLILIGFGTCIEYLHDIANK